MRYTIEKALVTKKENITNVNSLEVDNNGETREKYHGKKAVAKDTDHTTNRHATSAHQVEDNVHASTSHQPNTIDVAKVHLTMLYVYVCNVSE